METRVRTLAIVLPVRHEFALAIRNAVVAAVEEDREWRLVELPYHEDGRPPARTGLEALDGVIAWVGAEAEWLVRLASCGVPVVNCGGGFRDVPGISVMGTDGSSGLALALEHFVSLGLSEVALFAPVSHADRVDRTLEALRGRAESCSIKLRKIDWDGPHPADDATVLMDEASIRDFGNQLGEFPGPIGVFCEDDYLAALFVAAAIAAGRQVPREFAVLGAGNAPVSRLSRPTLSTIQMPGGKVGKAAFEEIKARVAGAPPSRAVFAVEQLLVRESTGGATSDPLAERIHRHIEQHGHRGLTVGELQMIAGCSTRTLRRRYRALFGEEPSAAIRRVRLEEIMRRLRVGRESLSEISAACGFTSLAAFNNFCRRHLGVSPTDVRKGGEGRKDD